MSHLKEFNFNGLSISNERLEEIHHKIHYLIREIEEKENAPEDLSLRTLDALIKEDFLKDNIEIFYAGFTVNHEMREMSDSKSTAESLLSSLANAKIVVVDATGGGTNPFAPGKKVHES